MEQEAMTFGGYILFIIGAILVNNILLVRFLGQCPFVGVSKKMDTALGMGMAVIFVITMAGAITWMVQTFILERYGLEYLRTIAFILVIASLVQLVEIVLQKSAPAFVPGAGNLSAFDYHQLRSPGCGPHQYPGRIRVFPDAGVFVCHRHRLYAGFGVIRQYTRTHGHGSYPQTVPGDFHRAGYRRDDGYGFRRIRRPGIAFLLVERHNPVITGY